MRQDFTKRLVHFFESSLSCSRCDPSQQQKLATLLLNFFSKIKKYVCALFPFLKKPTVTASLDLVEVPFSTVVESRSVLCAEEQIEPSLSLSESISTTPVNPRSEETIVQPHLPEPLPIAIASSTTTSSAEDVENSPCQESQNSSSINIPLIEEVYHARLDLSDTQQEQEEIDSALEKFRLLDPRALQFTCEQLREATQLVNQFTFFFNTCPLHPETARFFSILLEQNRENGFKIFSQWIVLSILSVYRSHWCPESISQIDLLDIDWKVCAADANRIFFPYFFVFSRQLEEEPPTIHFQERLDDLTLKSSFYTLDFLLVSNHLRTREPGGSKRWNFWNGLKNELAKSLEERPGFRSWAMRWSAQLPQ